MIAKGESLQIIVIQLTNVGAVVHMMRFALVVHRDRSHLRVYNSNHLLLVLDKRTFPRRGDQTCLRTTLQAKVMRRHASKTACFSTLDKTCAEICTHHNFFFDHTPAPFLTACKPNHEISPIDGYMRDTTGKSYTGRSVEDDLIYNSSLSL